MVVAEEEVMTLKMMEKEGEAVVAAAARIKLMLLVDSCKSIITINLIIIVLFRFSFDIFS